MSGTTVLKKKKKKSQVLASSDHNHTGHTTVLSTNLWCHSCELLLLRHLLFRHVSCNLTFAGHTTDFTGVYLSDRSYCLLIPNRVVVVTHMSILQHGFPSLTLSMEQIYVW